MDVENSAAVTSKKVDKSDSSIETLPQNVDSKKADKVSDTDDPKPRIVLTFRSEKPGAKTSNMKIVPTEDKHEDMSLRRSSRTRPAGYMVGQPFPSPDKESQPVSESDETSDNSRTASTPKRSSRRRSKEFDNVIANAIARKEKLYYEPQVPSRPSRRIKPTAKVLANEELRLESQSSQQSNQQDKGSDDGMQLRRSRRLCNQYSEPEPGDDKWFVWCQGTNKKEKAKSSKNTAEDNKGDSQNQVLKLKHLCELGLKARSPSEEQKDSPNAEGKSDAEGTEVDVTMTEDEEIDDDVEVINRLLDDDDSEDSDADFSCSDASQSEPTRKSKRISSYNYDSDFSLEGQSSGPRRRSNRKRRALPAQSYEDIVGSYLPQHKKRTSPVPITIEDNSQESDEAEVVSEAAAAEEGTEAACPTDDDSAIIATCLCEADTNIHAAPQDLAESSFCQAIDVVDGVRVGCSHRARSSGGAACALVRAGPRAPYMLACALHTRQLRAHMCCPACGLFCTQGTFYQCSEGHLFHLECGLPYHETTSRPGCPHCGVRSYRWQPANKETVRVVVTQHCTNHKLYLPEQREQCTPAYMDFQTRSASPGPVLPPELLPSIPEDMPLLRENAAKTRGSKEAVEALIEAIEAGETAEQLIPKIVCAGGSSPALHAAARCGHMTALYLLQYAGANINERDQHNKTPLLAAVTALLENSDNKSVKKAKIEEKDSTEDPAEDEKEESQEIKAGDNKKDSERSKSKEEDFLRVIRYLIVAGCDVNAQGPDGMTALHFAAQYGSESVCESLLAAASPPVEARDHGGWTPLVWAAEHDHHSVVRMLLNAGADAVSADGEGNAAVHWCCVRGAARALSVLIERATHNIHAINHHTDTPLHVAAREGHYTCVVVLLAKGARTDIENSAGELPVDVCTGACRTAISLNMQMTLPSGEKTRNLRVLCSDISRGRERYPIPCVNEVDAAALPDDFTYVTEHVMPDNIPLDNSIQAMQGCSCATNSCSSGSCACSVLGVQAWWARGVLSRNFPYHDSPMIFECNQTCACDTRKCTNNVLTRLLRGGSLFIRAEVYRVGGARGWGARARAPVPRGTPVAVYTGELLKVATADTRANDQYLFALDVKQDLLEQCLGKTLLCVDACKFGGASRFFNHSCAASLAPVRVFTARRDLRAPHVLFVATRDLNEGDALTFDYGDRFWSVKSKFMKCECGAPDCRYTELATDDTTA